MKYWTVWIVPALMVALPAAAQTCTVSSVQNSAKVRELQSILMVGALQCRFQSGSTVLADYNRFIQAHKGALQNHNGVLRAHFVRVNGKSGVTNFDRFTTRLANAHAQNASTVGFCDNVSAMVRTAAETPSEQLPDLAAALLPESPACVQD